MNEKIGMVIFVTIFFLIYASLNYFVITSYAKLLKIATPKCKMVFGVREGLYPTSMFENFSDI